MADTEANQTAYPQPSFQKEGLGFPICRLVGIISLSYAFPPRTVGTSKDFFSEMELVELNSEIASLFAKVRADYKIKTPDAVQLASAVYAKDELFVTNDDGLSQFESDGCRVLLLSDFL